ncbi:MAG: formate C-acetyltransferase [Zetaproteobacteria bacterium CG12_big_fil_rev_8_21_14_0_65_55_1124]|nr:MAG: formate C-acetyltransferase [Zetaproteobacteria bacterium CG1_02_55_237]PIS19017.1 MAG: formate C-acetyltransferase [Zetaproteobacteria bacterium CG08_land_8_20_14_0_20_55_17]PIW41937.1 MAG: formate C-acetyltransferase [Zetaproteobacteria bacterium CG12_big_fil_rev_8_21_14_0_65_55_1124]PIY53555.1 MAG: formate C-acetyltransferase [Zetaproteobacteria bacterium CG_4_10_14_0_8_um_filter_55_43]PIZ37425.1 MAG: formate C-acetyltransferase [Zetaproteobacteria bacterium CG_4_10_14_0_2_um_filter_
MNSPVKNPDLQPWLNFNGSEWQARIDVRDFIQQNYSPYTGDDSFLTPATERTSQLWVEISKLIEQERLKGVLDVSSDIGSSIVAHKPGYINENLELIVGLQTDAPLKRAIVPNGGLRMVEAGLEAYGFELDPAVKEAYRLYRKDHNQGVFDVYSPDILACRRSGIITGLPDAYGRGRIVGDYRRVALYGVDFLIADKKREKAELDHEVFSEEVLRTREELSEQTRALEELKQMAASYGFDIGRPAATAREAVQWTYFGYLAAIKEQNGAAMSIGRISSFLDIYIERDMQAGLLDESAAQELIDDLVIKLRIVRFLRTPEYDLLFSGDPAWVTEAIGGMGEDGRTLVTRSSFRFLHSLYNLGPAPEPNLTVLWSNAMPKGFKDFCSKVSIETSAIQYESDDLMREHWGDDYAIACCVSAMRIGKQMQFFGARCNLAKTMLYAINGGVDEKTGIKVVHGFEPIISDYLDYDEVVEKFDEMMDWLATTYIKALNAIHFMHDKYHYERLEMALHDRDVMRTMACGIAGLSVAADSLSAIKHAKVRVLRDEQGLATDFAIEGEYPAYGNNDNRADEIAVWLVETFMEKIRKHKTYRGSVPTQSVLTITSNVVYGKKTGNTPDGRRAGEPFAPGANAMNGRDKKGFIASGASVAKLPYRAALDGISWTATCTPDAFGHTVADRVNNLSNCIDMFCNSSGFHVNVNVLSKETLLDAMEHPENYPQLTLRVSGYAVNFIKLTREQQLDVINRTFHLHF